LDLEARRARALELRITTAQQQLRDPFPQPQPNGDEDRYDIVGLANFTKALPHNDLGEVVPAAYRALLRALRSGRSEDFTRVPVGGSLKLVNPEGACSFEPPRPGRPHAVPQHRPGAARVSTGPYVSQFLLQPYTFGSTPTQQRYRTTVAGSDHLTSYDAWLAVQNGQPTTATARYGPQQVLAQTHPCRDHPTQTGAVTFGAPDILDQVTRSANAAMKAAWYHKWLVHRRLRPEEAGGRIHNHLTGAKAYPLHPKLTDSAVLDRLYSTHGSYLCPQAYPEGCPTHPAYPGATATIGGAGVRVLKAMFNPEFVIPDPVVPTDDGLSLLPYKGKPLTVGGELNKLAFNMAFGRGTAGVHFRKDEVEGIVLAE
jgi:hypothetical protein